MTCSSFYSKWDPSRHALEHTCLSLHFSGRGGIYLEGAEKCARRGADGIGDTLDLGDILGVGTGSFCSSHILYDSGCHY